MSNYNHVVLIGHLGNDPEVFRKGSNPPFAKVQIATNKTWKTKDGEKKKRTTWHSVIFNRKLAELAEKHLRKGDLILASGELSTQKWLDKDGNKRSSVVIQARELRFLTPKPQASEEVPDNTDIAENDEYYEGDEGENNPF